ncbi:MAG: peptidylprolyl isomerase [Thermoanaerobaculum sp.]
MRPKLVLGLALLLSACQRGPRPLALVAGKPITWADVEQAVERNAGRPASQVAPELVGQVFADLLEEEVVLAASGNPEDRVLAEPHRSQRARQLLIELCPPPPPPAPEELQHALAQEGGGEVKERVFLRQLILPGKAQAQEARERLLKGQDFFALSREVSRAPNAATGGAIGWVERGQLSPEFEAAVSNLEAGQFSQPVESSAGWHVFYVEKKERGPDPARLEELRQELTSRKVEKARGRCLRELASKVSVRVFCQDAPFPCRNPFGEEP